MFRIVSLLLVFSAWNAECAQSLFLDEVQSVAVRGTLLCGKVPMANVPLKLYDVDRLDPDDLMATSFTDENGDFFIAGHEMEMSNIDPVLKIYHKCNDEGLPCDRKWRIGIPDKYITHNNRTPQTTMDLGVMNAEIEIDGETHMYCWLSASLALLLFVQCGAFRRQSVAVRGKLLCGGKPASDILVKLVDDDRGPDPDDLLDSTYTSDEGIFLLKGGTMELTDIDPEIRIYHDCNDHGKPCQREWVIGIPDKYISSGSEPKNVMNLGELNLEVELESEDHDCIH